MFKILAHAEEVHSGQFDSLLHYGDTWYIAIPFFFVITAMIAVLAWIVGGKDMGTVLILQAIWLLIVGFGLFSISPIVSAIAIVAGMLVAGFLVLAGLSSVNK